MRRHTLLRHLDEVDLRSLAAHTAFVRFDTQESIFRQGAGQTDLLIVVTGRVSLSATSAEGRELLVRVVESGQMLGEIAVIDGHPRSYDALALEPTDLLIVQRKDLIPFLEARPQLCILLMAALCERVRRSERRVQDALFLRVGPRLARELLFIAESCGRAVGDSLWLETRISQRELAALVGVTRESVNKQLVAWQAERLIKREGRTYRIIDLATLRQIAD